jgi:hypothetical protein
MNTTSNHSISSLTLASLANYRSAATQAVGAYRLGGHRLVKAVNAAIDTNVAPQAAKFAPRAADRLQTMRGNVSQIVVKGIDQVALRTERAIEVSADSAAAQVAKVVDMAGRIDNPMVANGLQTAARFSLPGAKLALVVSSKVAQGATKLYDAAGGQPVVVKAVRKAVRKSARKVEAAVKPVVKARSAQAVKTVKSVKRAVSKTSIAAPFAAVAKTAKATRTRVAKSVAI